MSSLPAAHGAADASDAAVAAVASTAATDVVVALRDLRVAAAPLSSVAVLRGLSLTVQRGEQVALIGSSGAGKTSLLHALACAVPPLAGTLSLFGEAPWSLSSGARQRLRGRLFLAPQVPPLPPRQRVVTAVLAGRLPTQSLMASLRTLWHPREAAAAQAALAALDLGDKLWERVDRLSGGERQRVGLARALIADAELWLIDEPLSALDPAHAAQVIDSLTHAARSAGRTLVCTLHQVEVARRSFPRIVALREGVIVYDGPASDFSDAQVAALYGARGLAGEPAASGPGVAEREDSVRAARPQLVCR